MPLVVKENTIRAAGLARPAQAPRAVPALAAVPYTFPLVPFTHVELARPCESMRNEVSAEVGSALRDAEESYWIVPPRDLVLWALALLNNEEPQDGVSSLDVDSQRLLATGVLLAAGRLRMDLMSKRNHASNVGGKCHCSECLS